MLFMHMHAGDWPVLLKFKVSKNPFEGSLLPSVVRSHSCSLWGEAQITIRAPGVAGAPKLPSEGLCVPQTPHSHQNPLGTLRTQKMLGFQGPLSGSPR